MTGSSAITRSGEPWVRHFSIFSFSRLSVWNRNLYTILWLRSIIQLLTGELYSFRWTNRPYTGRIKWGLWLLSFESVHGDMNLTMILSAGLVNNDACHHFFYFEKLWSHFAKSVSFQSYKSIVISLNSLATLHRVQGIPVF